MTSKVHACIVLDRSGSMESCRTDAIGAVNGYLRRLREEKDTETSVSLITFDSESIDTIRDHVAIAGCADLAAEEYQPRASTPLFDAVGRGVGVLDKGSGTGERRVLAIMTDGLENASREFNKDTIKALLERRQQQDGWLVIYLGAGHDAWAQASSMGVMAGNAARFSTGAVPATMGRMYARQMRYVRATDAKKEAQEGGFTADERAEMQGEEPQAKGR